MAIGHKPAGPLGRESEPAFSPRRPTEDRFPSTRLVMHHLRSCPRPTGNTPKRAATRTEQDELLGEFMSARRRDKAGLRAPLTVVREKRFSCGRCRGRLDRSGDRVSGLAVGLSGHCGAARPSTRWRCGAARFQRGSHGRPQALGAVGASGLAQYAPAPTHLACCCLAPVSTGSLLCWQCRILEGCAPAPRRRFARTSGPA